MVSRVQYLCNICKISQIIAFTDDMKEQYITRDPNGLSLYSHIHLCENGMAGVNNLFIDHNLDVRSYSFIELPLYKPQTKISVPGAPKIIKDKDTVKLTHITYKNDFNLLIQFNSRKLNIEIGEFSKATNKPIQVFLSPFGTVNIQYFESDINLTPQLNLWFSSLVENLEILVPAKIGLIVEILQFIIKDQKSYPSDLDKNIIQTILVSHDIFFELDGEVDISQLFYAYGEDNGILMLGLVKMIESNAMVNLHEMVLEFKKSAVTIMFALLILEVHGVVTIYRPSIMSDDVDMDSLVSL